MKYCKAVPLLSNMHVLSLTLRCTAVGLHLYLTPTFLVADHTVSPMLSLNWNVFCHKLAGLGIWPWGSAWSGRRWVIIVRKATDSTDNLLPEVTLRIFWYPFEGRIIWILLLVFSEKNKTVDNSNVNEVIKKCLPPPWTFALHIVGGQYLVRSVHSIHILIVHCKDLRLTYIYCVPYTIFIFYSTLYLNRVISITSSGDRSYYFTVNPLQDLSYSGHDGSCPKTMVEGLGTPIPVNSYTYFN